MYNNPSCEGNIINIILLHMPRILKSGGYFNPQSHKLPLLCDELRWPKEGLFFVCGSYFCLSAHLC